MTLSLAIAIYFSLVAVVFSIMLYYLKVMRPKEEEQFKGGKTFD
jgi:uncharacterized protein YpmB